MRADSLRVLFLRGTQTDTDACVCALGLLLLRPQAS